jgi:hypothetical protein
MTQHDFEAVLRRATDATLAASRLYVVDELPDECRYRIVAMPAWEPGPLLDAVGVARSCWKDGLVPAEVRIVPRAVQNGKTVLHLFCSLEMVDPSASERRERWAAVPEPSGPLLPFLVRIPTPPKGWRVFVNGRPDLDRSVAEHGKYRLPGSPGL